jgi:hypothetical protein
MIAQCARLCDGGGNTKEIEIKGAEEVNQRKEERRKGEKR